MNIYEHEQVNPEAKIHRTAAVIRIQVPPAWQ